MNLYLIRHAHAGSRGHWNGPDAERPLSAKGRDEANDITEMLSGQPIARVLSSPALRCQQTVAGVALSRTIPVEVEAALAEGAPLAAAKALLDALVSTGDDVVVCGHGDLLPELIESYSRSGATTRGAGCAKGSVWHLAAVDGRIESATYHRHPEPGLLPDD